jgi:hypothetical protein
MSYPSELTDDQWKRLEQVFNAQASAAAGWQPD